jgi:putative PIN family toxin of toxin-antitoxin system
MRVVVDTNVLARAVPSRSSPARQVLEALLAQPHVLVASDFLLSELGRVLRYPRVQQLHGLEETALDSFVQSLRDASLVVEIPTTSAPVASDKDDDPIIATAVEGQADVPCTWDRHFFAPEVTEYLAKAGIRVLRDTDLLRELQPPAPSASE